MSNDLQWSTWPWNRCSAYREHRPKSEAYWGQCDLRKSHEGDHALERGMMILFWSTDWTNFE